MRNLLVIVLFIVAFVRSYVLQEFPGLPSQTKYILDGVLAIAAVAAIARLTVTGRWAQIPIAYLLLFGAFVYCVVTAFVINDVSPDVLFAGVRNYFRFVVPFLIPIAFDFTQDERLTQIKTLLALVALQIPVTLWQRLFEYHQFTGDNIVGTVSSTSSISILSAIVLVMVIAAHLCKKVSFGIMICVFLLVLIPAGLSETKATPIFVIAGLAALLFCLRSRINSGQLMAASIGAGFFLMSFVLVYDLFYTRESGEGFLDLLTDKERMIDNYNYKGIDAKSIKLKKQSSVVVGEKEIPLDTLEEKEVGRLDTLVLPFDALLPNEPLRLAIGLGIGNVDSGFGQGGDYRVVKFELGASRTSISILIWETGVIGMLIFVAFILLLTKDAYVLAQANGPNQAFAAGYFGVAAITGLSLIYVNIFHLSEISALLAFMSGLLVSDRMAAKTQTPAKLPLEHTNPAFVGNRTA